MVINAARRKIEELIRIKNEEIMLMERQVSEANGYINGLRDSMKDYVQDLKENRVTRRKAGKSRRGSFQYCASAEDLPDDFGSMT